MYEGMIGKFLGATFDSRLVKPGMLYVALKGENTDGHRFVAAALKAGAALALVRRDWPAPAEVDETRLARVDDPRLALGEIAREYRLTLGATVIGVTGSAGKTTVKEMTAAFLRASGRRVHATAGNFNNDLGLPITILGCPADADFLVVEMGTNHPGEIARLVDIARPDVGLISSIGTAHIEFFKSQDGIAEEKGTLFARLGLVGRAKSTGSFAVLARENDRYTKLVGMSSVPVKTVSFADQEAAAFAEKLERRLPGRHNVLNAMIAYGCAREFGASLDSCLAALDSFTLPGGRWRMVEKGGVTYFDDTYNANPTSMMAALETFAGIKAERHLAVLGDMFELGEDSARFHREVGARAGSLPIDELVCVGESSAREMAPAARGAGGSLRIQTAVDAAAAAALVKPMVRPGDVVLVKASHGMHLDQVIEAV